jgi:hypothetical protein
MWRPYLILAMKINLILIIDLNVKTKNLEFLGRNLEFYHKHLEGKENEYANTDIVIDKLDFIKINNFYFTSHH